MDNIRIIDRILSVLEASRTFLVSEGHPQITLKGLEYLNENSLMQRAMRMSKGIKDCVPGIEYNRLRESVGGFFMPEREYL